MAQTDDDMKLDISDELIAERRAGEPGETPEDMHPVARWVVSRIDLLNNLVGKITCLLLVPVIGAMVYEVVARKLFIAPTDWAYDTSRMLSGAMFMLGAGYALMRGVHIRADFLYRSWKPQTQALVDITLYLLFYMPAMLFFFWITFEYSVKAWVRWELTMDSALMAPLAPMRTAMPVGVFLLILQGIAEVLRAMHSISANAKKMIYRILPFYFVVFLTAFLGVFYPEIVSIDGVFDAIGLTSDDGLSPELIGVIMIAVMLLAIFIGFPISFTLIFLGFVFGAWGFGTKLVFHLQTLQFNNVMLEQTLAAVPLFVFMGIMME